MKKTIVSIFIGLTLSGAALADDLATVFQLAQANDPVINRAKAQKEAASAGINVAELACFHKFLAQLATVTAIANRYLVQRSRLALVPQLATALI